jgi:tRNA A37 threonylcarbamoyladenosine modification protein TsaB
MKILAIDTTAVTAAAALVEDGHILGTYQQNGTLTHSETMLNMV